MKKIFTLIVAFLATASMMAQSKDAMTFVGKSSIKVLTANVENAVDTVMFKMNGTTSGDITIPSLSYSMGKIPSFTIHNASFTMDMTTMAATFSDQTFSETVTVGGEEKKITGTSLKGIYKRSTNTFDLIVKFKYGVMPFEATYTIKGYYVKPFTDKISVTVGSEYGPYNNESVTYNIRTYDDNGTTKMDVNVPYYILENTVMGTLYIGTYTVKGLTYDESKGGYYKDYAADGLSMHFKNVTSEGTGMNGDYALSTVGGENILVEINDTKAKITNNFQPGAMPFPITSIFGENSTGINNVGVNPNVDNSAAYNLSGQRISANAKGIIIRNGKKYFEK